MHKKFAPIVLFTYNRLSNTKKTISCLLKNSECKYTDIFIFSDAPKNENAISSVNDTRTYLHQIRGFKRIQIIERTENWGLAKNIVDGVSKIVNKYGRVIVLEDDLSVSPYFLKYMNEGLDKFESRNDIVCIHGYVYPHKNKLPEVFLIKGADCWGWATWKRGWDVFNNNAQYLYDEIIKENRISEFTFNNSYPYMEMLRKQIDGSMNSWAICWYASTFLKNLYTIYPNESMVFINSIGEGGVHGSEPSKYVTKLKKKPIEWNKAFLEGESVNGRRAFEDFFLIPNIKKSKLFVRIFNIAKRIIHKW